MEFSPALGMEFFPAMTSHEGGKRAAIIYSIIETCKQNNINTYDYLKDVLTRIPSCLQKNIGELLPYNWQPPNTS